MSQTLTPPELELLKKIAKQSRNIRIFDDNGAISVQVGTTDIEPRELIQIHCEHVPDDAIALKAAMKCR